MALRKFCVSQKSGLLRRSSAYGNDNGYGMGSGSHRDVLYGQELTDSTLMQIGLIIILMEDGGYEREENYI